MTVLGYGLVAQPNFSRQDTLRGSITPEREWWDLTYYHLSVSVDPKAQTIEGTNLIQYRVLDQGQRMQIDLQPPMEATAFRQGELELDFEQEGNVYWVSLPSNLEVGEVYELTVAPMAEASRCG